MRFFGTRQHGIPNKSSQYFKHIKVLKLAQEESNNIFREDKTLNKKRILSQKKSFDENLVIINNQIALN